jgi:hypothetical protein
MAEQAEGGVEVQSAAGAVVPPAAEAAEQAENGGPKVGAGKKNVGIVPHPKK